MKKRKRNKNIMVCMLIMMTLFTNLAYLSTDASEVGTMSVLVNSAYDGEGFSVDSIAYNDTNGWIQVVIKGSEFTGVAKDKIQITSNEITGLTIQKQTLSDEVQITGDFSKLYTPSLNVSINGNYIKSRVLYEMQTFVDNIFAPANPLIDEETQGLISNLRDFILLKAPSLISSSIWNSVDILTLIEENNNLFVFSWNNSYHGEMISILSYDGSISFEEYDESNLGLSKRIIGSSDISIDAFTFTWNKNDFNSISLSDVRTGINFTPSNKTSMYGLQNIEILTTSEAILNDDGSVYSFQDLTEYLDPDYNIDDATNTNALHTIELIHESSSSNTFTFQALVDSRACDNRLFVTFDSNSSLSANFKSDVTHDDITFYVYDLTLNLDVFGEKEETIVIKYGGDEVFSKPFTLNNTTAPAPSVEDDIFYLRTLDNYIDFVLETNSKNLYQEVDAYRLLDNANQATVKEFPSYYKRFEEELDGYSQPRYRYTFRFPSESFESEMFLRGQIDFSDGTQMTSNNMIDYQLKTWGDTGEYVQDSPIYDNLPDIDNEQVYDTINDAKTTYRQTVQEMEQSPFGQKMKAFFGANWLLILIGIIVFAVVLWG